LELEKIADKRWNFDFADVEMSGNKLVVNSLIPFKDLKKKYNDLIDELSDENQETLKKTFAKKRIREETISFLNKDELIEFFNRIAVREGIDVEAGPAAAAPVSAAASSTVTRPTAEGMETPTTETEEPVESKYNVSIIESIDFNAKHNGEIIDSTVNGQIIVKNDGNKDRIWDIDIELSGGDNTDLKEKKFHINELDPQEDWTKDYKIEITSDDKPPIVLEETIDAFPESEEDSHTFLLNEEGKSQDVKMNIKIENTSDSTVSTIVLTKAIPEDFKKMKVKGETKGSAGKEDEGIEWKVEELGPGESAELDLTAEVEPSSIKMISSGELKIKYMLEAGTYSGLKPEMVDGLSEEIYYIDRDERDEEPDIWDCQFIFENRSEFPMKLQKFTFISGDEDTEYEVNAQEPDYIVNPGKEWVSMPWDLDSEDEPTFSEYVLYTVWPNIEERLSMSSTYQALEMPVLAVEGVKDYSKNVLRSYRAETLDATIITTIKGDAPIDIIRFEDTIPIDFKNPDKADMEVIIDIKGDKKTIPQEDVSISFEPDLAEDDFSRERKMNIEIVDVIENVGNLDDNSTISVKYPLNAIKPTKNAKYDAPVLFQGITKPSGGILEAYIEPEPITVVHERRRTRIGKSIRPGDDKDYYSILLLYKNKGDSLKTNVKMSDFVPSTFSIIESSLGYESTSKDDGTLLTWTINEIQPGEEVEVTYVIHGEGDAYSLKNIEARAFK
jgi:hypothetical protein